MYFILVCECGQKKKNKKQQQYDEPKTNERNNRNKIKTDDA